MYDVEKHSAVLENAYVYTLGKKLRVPPNAVQVGMPPALSS